MREPGWSNDPVTPAAPAVVLAPGQTAGPPGSWTPEGAAPCATFAEMGTITA